MPRRAEPERTCVGCRAAGPKGSLLRIVRGQGGEPTLDPEGVALGRGAYVHPEKACVDLALRGGGIARGLRVGLGSDAAVRLREAIESMGAL